MTTHITMSGIDEDEMGFVLVICDCGFDPGPLPDVETAMDVMMEHAYEAGVHDGQEIVASATRTHGVPG